MCQEELKFVAFHHRLFLIWPSQVEQPPCTNRVDRLVYPPLPPKPSVDPRSRTANPPPASPTSSSTSTSNISEHTSEKRAPLLSAPVPKPRFSSKTPLAKPTFIFPAQSVAASSPVTSRSPASNPAVAPQPPPGASLAVNASAGCKDNHNLTTAAHNQNTRPLAPTWTLPAGDAAAASPIQPGVDILSLMKVTFSPTPDSPPKTSAATVSAEVRQRLKELLSKYSTGLWVHALPALFLDTYKTPFPEHVLENLTALLDICNVEYPIPGNKDKVSESDEQSSTVLNCPHRFFFYFYTLYVSFVYFAVVRPSCITPAKQTWKPQPAKKARRAEVSPCPLGSRCKVL